MSSLPELEEFGLIGMAQAERIEGDQRWFSLPTAILDRLPRIMLKEQFRDTSAPLVAGPTMPFVVDGIWDVRLYAIWAQKRGNLSLETISGVGDLSIVRFCEAALAPLPLDYRGRECKKFLGLLEQFAAFKSPKLLLAYLPCLSFLSLVDVNLTDGKSIMAAICESSAIPKDDQLAVAHQLGKTAQLIGLMVMNNLPIFTPDRYTPKIEAVQIKAWAAALLKTAKSFSSESRSKLPLAASRNTGAELLLDAAQLLNSAVADQMKIVRRTRQQVAPVAIEENIETEPGPDCVEVIDDDEIHSSATPDAAQETNFIQPKPIFVVDLAVLKADSALVKLCQEHWNSVKLARLASAMKTQELRPEIFELIAQENPHAEAPLLAVARSLRLHAQYGRKSLTFKPLLFAGEAGTGKSYIARRVAAACDLPCLFLPLAGMSDSREIVGTPRGWSTTGPSIARILGEGFANPFVIFDEIDKCGTSNHNGNALSALLPLLEKSTAKVWYDPFFGCAVDCSMINIIATANSLTGLPAPLLSRFQVFHIRPPEKAHYPKIIASVIGEVAADLGVHPGLLPALDGEDIEFLINNCRDIRTLSLTVRRILEHRSAEAHQGVLH